MRLSVPSDSAASTAAPASSACTCTEYWPAPAGVAMRHRFPQPVKARRAARPTPAASQPLSRYITSNCGAADAAVPTVRSCGGDGT